MVDLDILAEHGFTREALRDFFTACHADHDATDEEKEAAQRKVEKREKFEARISGWISESVGFSLRNHRLYSAVDIAWDSTPINKALYPLMLYAQGRLNLDNIATALKDVPNADKYVKKDSSGKIIGVDLPCLLETEINIVRSVITRRLAAQANKYNNLFPFFKYESRSNSLVGRLRADATSQRMDIMADQYGYKHLTTQVIRDMLLYARSVCFPTSPWEREVQWLRKDLPEELEVDTTVPQPEGEAQKTTPKDARVVKEGVCWVNPHPARVLYDRSFPLASLNTDTGCEYVGYWDVKKYGDIRNNLDYFNRDAISYSPSTIEMFSAYVDYWETYFETIKPPTTAFDTDPATQNDAKMSQGLYTSEMEDMSVFLAPIFVKVIPSEMGIGDYPYPVWIMLHVAGDDTVVYADIMPSSPAAVFSYNEHDGRVLSLSVAMELLRYQDAITNLTTQLLETAKRDLFAVAILNTDVFPDTPEGQKVLAEFRALMSGNSYYVNMQMLEASFSKLRDLGIDITAENIFKVQRTGQNTAITQIFNAIAQLISLAERMIALSPQEQGQPAPREISATETNMIAGTTESVYGFISEAVDEGRDAMKRICYESMIICGSDSVSLPVVDRYPEHIIKKAGFAVEQEDGDTGDGRQIKGRKWALLHDYIFTTRDGAERATNTQSATVLVELMRALGSQPPEVAAEIYRAIGKEKVLDIWNEIFRLSGAVDLKLGVKPGDSDEFMPDETQGVLQAVAKLAEAVKQNTARLQALEGGGPAAAPQAM